MPNLHVTDDQKLEIATSLGVQENSQHVIEVINAIHRFDGRRIAVAELPSENHRKRDIKTLSSLASAMEGLNYNILALLASYGIDFNAPNPTEVAAAAREAVEILKQAPASKDGGRYPIFGRDIFFQDLAKIYTKATNNTFTISMTSESNLTRGGQPSGPAFRFVQAAVNPIPELKKLSTNGLASATKRATSSK